VTSAETSARRLRILESRGIRVVVLPLRRRRGALKRILRELGALGISQLLVEGGATLAGSFLDEGQVHEIAAYIACRLAGGRTARGAVDGEGIGLLRRTPWLSSPEGAGPVPEVKRLGPDVLIAGRLTAGPPGLGGREEGAD